MNIKKRLTVYAQMLADAQQSKLDAMKKLESELDPEHGFAKDIRINYLEHEFAGLNEASDYFYLLFEEVIFDDNKGKNATVRLRPRKKCRRNVKKCHRCK